MSKPEVYAISNLDGYAQEIINAAAKTLSDAPSNDLDNYVSVGQVINLVKQKCIGYDDMDRPILDETINESIYEDVTVWIHNVGLAKLAGQDLIECAWDNDLNDMVFWAKDKKTKKEKKPNAKRSKPKSRRKDMGNKEQDC